MGKRTIPLFKVHMADTAAEEVTKVLNSGYIGEGPKVIELEQMISRQFDCWNGNNIHHDVITCNSATSAEHLIYHMLKKPNEYNSVFPWGAVNVSWGGLTSDNTVLTTPLTCTATNWPILLNGLKLKWVDVDPNTMNMDLDDLEQKIDETTRIITVVHWGGYPIDMDRLNRIVSAAKSKFGNEILIVEDCAHAFGSTYKGKYVGFQGNLSTFSLQAIKHITSVDGGLLISPFKEFSERAKLLRWYGIDRNTPRIDFRCEQDIPEPGFKFHMNDISATVGIENLKHADTIIGKHRSNAFHFNKHLRNIPGVELLEVSDDFNTQSAYWLYTIKVKDRLGFMKMMADRGIAVSRVHERNDKHSCVSQFKTDLPKMESFIDEMICIPVGWWVTREDREYIVDAIKGGW